MTPHHEHVVRGAVVSEHPVHLFDEPQSLAATVAVHLNDGWIRGDRLLVVARPVNWALTAAELARIACPVDKATPSGRLVVLDAATTIARPTLATSVQPATS